MTKKKKRNFLIPEAFSRAFDDSLRGYGERQKWIGATGAIYFWLSASREEQHRVAMRMVAADASEREMAKLVEELSAMTTREWAPAIDGVVLLPDASGEIQQPAQSQEPESVERPKKKRVRRRK